MATHFVTQSGGETIGGSTAYSAANFNANTDSFVAAGNTIYICNTITTKLSVPDSGAAGSPITIRGDYPGYEGVINKSDDYPLGLDGGGGRTYIDVINLTVNATKAAETYGIYFGGSDSTADRNINVVGCTVNQPNATAGGALQGNGRYLSARNCVINAGCDGLNINGRYLTVSGCTMICGLASTGGDGVQVDHGVSCGSSGAYIANNTITVVSGSTKQGIYIAADDEAAPFGCTISNNRITMAGTTFTAGIYADLESSIVTGNYVYMPETSGTSSMYGYYVPQASSTVYGNIAVGGKRGFQGGNVASQTFVFNTASVASEYGFYLVFNQATMVNKNNLAYSCATGMRRYTAVPQSYCGFYDNTTNVRNESDVAVAVAATDEISASDIQEAGIWIAGVRAYDDLSLPLRPDIGAVQNRNLPGRRFGIGGGSL